MKLACGVFGEEGVKCQRRERSSMKESKEWTTPIGQNGGRRNLKRVSEPAVMTERSNEWKGRNDKLASRTQKRTSRRRIALL